MATVTEPDHDRPIVVEVENLVKTFDNGRVRALDGVSFSVPEGQLLVIIGLSGSGKSTLLRHLNGLHQPTDGSVHVLGVDVPQDASSEGSVATWGSSSSSSISWDG